MYRGPDKGALLLLFPKFSHALIATMPTFLFNLHPYYAYIASEDNAADDPTRGRPVRAPSIPEPLWLQLGKRGDFSELDRLLHLWGVDPLQLQGIPQLLDQFASRDRKPAFPPGLFSRDASQGPTLTTSAHRPLDFADPSQIPEAQPQHQSSMPKPPSALQAFLPPPALDFLHSCRPRHFLWPSGHLPPAQLRFSQSGYLCLYAGNRGVAKEVVRLGVLMGLDCGLVARAKSRFARQFPSRSYRCCSRSTLLRCCWPCAHLCVLQHGGHPASADLRASCGPSWPFRSYGRESFPRSRALFVRLSSR